ncbi:relaxase/mobilization nuclease domain-containing protein [Flavobacterium sp. CSZ]|uniref:relaxase/mobilization nuclease domain-containing protein n=1 Tax=Flavobacterium sp. CSZ TaxID=2783791 RepID=UPI00188B7555|nr:relaxase/mobilization nuclease domain-containing protein [Flavobacterium sp. CSZ]MBF4487751.1 relaxase/mobilization nuclease domain-containing protein [Flavobacterium sp. CSZ]
MVTIIKISHSIASILSYNENKVKTGAGECIKAANFPLELEKLTFTLKLNRFLNRAKLNENAKRNTVHISLNFHPLDNLSKEVLIEITDTYMEKIGFSKQPYLIYQHHDAGHPHLHIITNNIERDGKRIDLHHLAIKKSEPARKEIEKVFGLVKAEGRKNKEVFSLDPIPTSKVRYGEITSMKAISNVLNRVLNTYKYCNLQELNAVLKQYNVMADPGKEDSKMFTSKGLLYRILDEKGNTVGFQSRRAIFIYSQL